MKLLLYSLSSLTNEYDRNRMLHEFDAGWAKYQEGLRTRFLPIVSWGQFSFASIETNAFELIQKNWKVKENLYQIVTVLQREVIITNAEFEIVFASEGIVQMNGYESNELIGKSPRMFQGELTSEEVKATIKNAMKQHKPFKEVLLNYKKDGSTYFCEIEAFPKFSSNGTFLNYIAFERIAS
ncbi:PAS domain-containing protein [Flavobacterium sp. GCM10027622]|uniref:PAS domain-containing protein n=1 Tax=unclassified Flavobacterium TaxID=196869 RepID=UPI0036233D20